MKKIEYLLKSILLRILLISKRRKKNFSDVKFCEHSRLLFIRLNRIGDALVTTPFIRAVKSNLHCNIDVLADGKNSFIFHNNPDISNIFLFNKGLAGYKEAGDLMKKNNYDAIVDLHDDISTTVSFLLAASPSPYVFGLSKGNDNVYTHTVPRPDARVTHVVDRLMALGKLFNISPDHNCNIQYYITPKTIEKVTSALQKKFAEKRFLLGINISSGSSARYWGTERYTLLKNALARYNINPLILCTTRDINHALAITNNKNDIFYSPSFEEFSAVISRLNLLFTPDTSIVHIASAFNIPVFGLYVKYKTSDMIWSPYKSDFDCVVTEEPNLHNISFNEVIDKFIPFLEKHLKNEYSKL